MGMAKVENDSKLTEFLPHSVQLTLDLNKPKNVSENNFENIDY